MKNEKGEILAGFIVAIVTIFIIFGFYALLCIRLDFESGSHKIIPTAVDQDMCGNYKVYFRTTEYTKNNEEDFYYIDKNNTELAEEIRECIKNEQTIIVYYDKYVGWKGITAPSEAPITKIELIESEEN